MRGSQIEMFYLFIEILTKNIIINASQLHYIIIKFEKWYREGIQILKAF